MDPVQRGEWLDILVALIELLKSGESKVGFLNNSVERNMLHKDGFGETQEDMVQSGQEGVRMVLSATVGRSSGKRKFEGDE